MTSKAKGGKAGGGGPKAFTFSLTMPGLIIFASGVVGALCAFFILGVLVGRGYQPEQAVPELARIMPAPQPDNATSRPETAVLKPEELQFMEQLKQKPPRVVEETDAAPKLGKPKAVKPETVKPDSLPPPPPAPKASQGEGAFQYVYQVASLPDKAAAEKYRDKMARSGMESSIEVWSKDGKTFHRVLVSFKGTQGDARFALDKLAQLGVKQPMLKTKKPL